jgi:serine/threonine protein phosphatase PrpC
MTTGEYEQAESTGLRASERAGMGAGIGWDPGITRKHKPNEDAVLAVRGVCDAGGRLCPVALYVVADGMGGHASGRVASHLATRSLMQSVLPAIQQGEELDDTFLMDTLTDCIHQANAVVHAYKEEHGVDLGTTITAALLVESTAYIVNVGDSRTYIYRRDDGLAQITRDHSLVARLVAAGAIAAEDVYTHPDRNKIYRGLGEKDSVQVDWFIEPVRAGDYVLLCSDGLWEMVRDSEIEQILKRCLPDVTQASQALIKAALHRGGSDNVSVIVAPV